MVVHDQMNGTILSNVFNTDQQVPQNDVQWGCVIALSLFSIFLPVILFFLKKSLPIAIDVECTMDGSVIRHHRTKMSILKTSIVVL